MYRLGKWRRKAESLLECNGLMADITFKRLHGSTSDAPHDIYGERRPREKSYRTWERKVQVDENPKANTFSRRGQVVDFDLGVTLYDFGTFVNEGWPDPAYDPDDYYPKYKDEVIWRHNVYEIIAIERVLPSTAPDCDGVEQDTQFALYIQCRRRT